MPFKLTPVLPLIDAHTEMLEYTTFKSWHMYFNMQGVCNFVVLVFLLFY